MPGGGGGGGGGVQRNLLKNVPGILKHLNNKNKEILPLPQRIHGF